MDEDLGTLIRTLKDRCPECQQGRLQIRRMGEERIGTRYFSLENVVCSAGCGYSIPLIPEKKRMERKELIERNGYD